MRNGGFFSWEKIACDAAAFASKLAPTVGMRSNCGSELAREKAIPVSRKISVKPRCLNDWLIVEFLYRHPAMQNRLG